MTVSEILIVRPRRLAAERPLPQARLPGKLGARSQGSAGAKSGCRDPVFPRGARRTGSSPRRGGSTRDRWFAIQEVIFPADPIVGPPANTPTVWGSPSFADR